MFQFMIPQFAPAQLEAAVVRGCESEEEWPAGVSAGIYAGIEFAIENPDVIDWLSVRRSGGYSPQEHQHAVCRLAKLLRSRAPRTALRLPPITEETLVGGVVGLVGEHLRMGRMDELRGLRPELVLLVLLPYLGFEDARNWANRSDPSRI